MRLQQNQVWKQGDQYIRIVQLERMAVEYKAMRDLATGEGAHHYATKKDFCRLLKNAVLLSADDIQRAMGFLPAPQATDAAGTAGSDEHDST